MQGNGTMGYSTQLQSSSSFTSGRVGIARDRIKSSGPRPLRELTFVCVETLVPLYDCAMREQTQLKCVPN
jgi:hypothetical protein